jgi:hypothetical protein
LEALNGYLPGIYLHNVLQKVKGYVAGLIQNGWGFPFPFAPKYSQNNKKSRGKFHRVAKAEIIGPEPSKFILPDHFLMPPSSGENARR